MSNLKEVFANKKAFIPFVVADDPDIETTVANVLTLAQNGADIVELGIPFSDPVADGPVIQKADLRAFKADVNTNVVFEIVEKIRQKSSVPIVFLTYLNIPFKYGYDKFCQRCQELDISGLVIPDAPIEEQCELKPYAEKYGVDLIPLIAPTSADRIEKIAQSATGFIYVVSSLGVTGVRDELAIQQLSETIERIKKVTDVPAAIGFGIHSSEQAGKLATIADGIIIGSAVVQIVADGGDVQKNLGEYALSIKDAISVKA
ncbi:tryptophan synthase subunit alpha [Companilactobacillus nantensis]|uniref:Tryptophan synthase alpha chain n=1 Tax=Companilactobacillus nantensis DSM 16982 TaxID=1423774 RepID=A0A0R1WUM9_9LACO|nr:tryptophan synthase subunit alpha [Companilactobacillus nantensis]KRM18092.1 tryptophan synthase subunit alpha [Companilactobacillus nantensis DSM 16982]GEO63735.1 tryptophan synthase alpha chain [Companilactobacillus nantensis]